MISDLPLAKGTYRNTLRAGQQWKEVVVCVGNFIALYAATNRISQLEFGRRTHTHTQVPQMKSHKMGA